MPIIDVKNRITNTDSEFSKFCHSDLSLIFTDAKKDDLDYFSFELRVGTGWALNYSESQTQLIEIPPEGVKIPRYGSVVVEVKEIIKVPHNLYGIIVPTGSLFLSKGILIAPAKIEPSFQGHLKLRLFNTTNEYFNLMKDSKLASAIFFPTATTVHHPPILRSSDVAKVKDTRIGKLLRWISRNKVQVITWGISLVSSSLLSTLIMYLVYYRYILTTP
jgi:deoxycytidine triphosphate deaminase